MAFEFSDRHIETYQTRGYTVFEQILPATLIADLRRVTDQAREMARDEGGAQTQGFNRSRSTIWRYSLSGTTRICLNSWMPFHAS